MRAYFILAFLLILAGQAAGVSATPTLFSFSRSAALVEDESATVEYANLTANDPPTSFLLYPLATIPFQLGPVGTLLPYSLDPTGRTLTVYLPGSKPQPSRNTATVIYFRRGGQANFAALQFPPGSYFVGEAGSSLPTQHDPTSHTLTIRLP
ncbi:MAG TPA: hypothetical protein VEX13_08695 [Chloroflexia bacterium]|nr:hypothetical protein [Chloroflexia bacterium]